MSLPIEQSYATQIFAYLVRIITLNAAALGGVYWCGRMMNYIKGSTAKNWLATIIIVGLAAWQQYVFWWDSNWPTRLYYITTFTLISFVPYVLICWRIYDRLDSYFDANDFKDKGPITKKKTKKKQ